MAMPKYAAILFAVASTGVALFQLALALGAPWGELTLGGRWRGRLPGAIRVMPLVSAALLAFFSAVLLARAGFGPHALEQFSPALAWVVVAYCALGCIANTITPSRRERLLWLPVVAVMLASSLVVALS